MSRVLRVFLSAVLVVSQVVAAWGMPTASAQGSECNDLPSLSLTQSVSAPGTYGIWLLVKRETPTAMPYVRIDDGACQRIAVPSTSDWTWVSGTSGTIRQTLGSGDHTFHVSVDGGAFLVDKILVSTDTNCDPSGNGQNCIEEPIDFVIEGLEQGSTVTGERRISALLSVETNDPVEMEFFVDAKSVAKQLEKPYCLIEGEASNCGLYNVSSLGEGKHTLSVAATTPGGQYVTKSVEFTVGKQNVLAPTVNTTTETTADLPDPLTISVEGIKEGDVVSGKKKVEAKVAGTGTPITVLFALNGNDLGSSSTAPYCMVFDETACDEWNSETVVNGEYVLYVRASSDGVKTKEASIKFSVKNSALLATSESDDKEIIVGNTNQQVSGRVRVTIPAKKLKELNNIKDIIYKLDGKVIGRGTLLNPAISLDTTKYPNKKHRITATLAAYNGETTDVSSEIAFRNDIGLSVSNWLRQNALVSGAVGLGLVIVLFVVIRFVSGRIKYRKLLKQHNLNTDIYLSPQVQHGHKWHMGYAMASVVVVAGLGLLGFRLGISEAGVGVGFVDEMENAKPTDGFSGVSLGYENNFTIAFARINYARPITGGTAPATPSPANNGDGFAINTASTGFEGESMSLVSSLGMSVPDASAHGALGLLIWGNGSAYKTVNSVAIEGISVRARGEQCNGIPTMQVKIDGRLVMTTAVNTTSWSDYSVAFSAPAGSHSFEISFLNDEFSTCDRNLFVDSVELLSRTVASTVVVPSTGSTTPSSPVAQAATVFTQDFNSGTNAGSVNMTDISGGGPHGDQAGMIQIRNGRVNADPDTTNGDTYATANYNFTADQFAEADLIIGSTVRGQYTGVNVRANLSGPNYSWYKLETVESSTQLRILTLKDNRIAAEYYANVPGGLNPNTTYRLRLEVSGTTLRAYVNGTALRFSVNGTSSETITDTFIANGRAGVNIYGTQSWLDNFRAGNLGGSAVATTPTPAPAPAPTPTPAPAVVHSGTMQHNGMGPLINNNAIPGPFPAMNGPVVYYNTGYVPFADDIGAFRTDCSVSHLSYDDPIVYPGRPGAAHLHTFFGNSGVNAYSTKESIETTGGSTCNGGTLNRTGYWMPTVLDRSGVPVMPERVLVYYKTSYYGVRAQDVIAPPAGLRMIAGNGASTTVQAGDPYGKSISSFACNSESFPYPVVTAGTSIDTYCPEGARQLFMEIRFPQCWDGRNLDSFDHKSHMAYPTGYGCPSSHPVAIAEIQLRVKYNYYGDRSGWRLSSDNYTNGPGGYSSHADWFNGWDRDTLQQITQNCWNAQRDCQVDNLGGGQRLGRNI